ncbi:hypothetical protein E7V67_001885 [[Empedobacter] haloabium]|uniref:Uncharacterized protein n=1 Tax=[Empedobacter] haloabium TaxID=592317 RepID=A0ABZ1UME4_9BURK
MLGLPDLLEGRAREFPVALEFDARAELARRVGCQLDDDLDKCFLAAIAGTRNPPGKFVDDCRARYCVVTAGAANKALSRSSMAASSSSKHDERNAAFRLTR